MTDLRLSSTPVATRSRGDRLGTGVALVLILYVFGFNLMPDGPRLGLAGGLLLGYLALALRHPPISGAERTARVALTVLVLLGIAGMARPGGLDQAQELLRFAAPLLGWLAFALRPSGGVGTGDLNLPLLQRVCVGAAAAATIQAVVNPAVLVSGTARLGSVTGGLDAMHPSAYACLGLALCFLAFLRHGVGARAVNLLCLLCLGALILGFGVRTVWLMTAVAGLTALLYAERLRVLFLGYAAFWGLGLVLIGAVFIDAEVWRSWSGLGSGRIGTYLDRIDLIAARGSWELAFGSGLGSDLMRGETVWRSTAKDSHNDFLTLTIEMGLLGLVSACVFLGAVFSGLRGGFAVAVGVSLLAASAVSNGALFRPNLPVLYGLAIALWRTGVRP